MSIGRATSKISNVPTQMQNAVESFSHFKDQQQPLPEIPEGRLVILDLTREVLVPEQVPFI